MSFLLYKPLGFTPLQAINLAKKQFPQYAHSTLGAAGRLDPMAEGLLLIMVDEENKQQDSFIKLNKIYEVEAILGIQTDSYDLLGIPASPPQVNIQIPKERIVEAMAGLTGKIIQDYPPYSAARVAGKPLFWWARESKLDQITIPQAEREVYEFTLKDDWIVKSQMLLESIHNKIDRIDGEFRQDKILDEWKKQLNDPQLNIRTIKLRIACSSGTYVRSLVHNLGIILTSGATVTNILRTNIGQYKIEDALHLDI